ncbi:hypothetical protein [Ralstonia mannitolilytica]|uniref:hypothetical protein n=1 Tax=Ralstonia mannitolilytica TaxID=105219 RepID=UPI0037494D60
MKTARTMTLLAATTMVCNTPPSLAQTSFSARERIETFCSVSPAIWESTAECVSRQEAFSKAIEKFTSQAGDSEGMEAISDCSGYVTGMRGLGSQESVDRVLVAKCLVLPKRLTVFQACVAEITGKQMAGSHVSWQRSQADRIADCFNAQLAKLK